MPGLTPNAPRKRLEWVLKTYWPKQAPAVIDTFIVAIYLFGLEGSAAHDTVKEARIYLERSRDTTYGRAAKQLLDVLLEREAFPATHANDFLLPWVARELSRLAKAKDNGEMDWETHGAATTLLTAKAPAIAMWARETRQNMGQVTLAQALEAVAGHTFATALLPPGGEVVYSFPDGYTIQELRDKKAFEAEGRMMQNCIGIEYYEMTLAGQCRLYSLRDPTGHPHVSMEWKTASPEPEEYDWPDRDSIEDEPPDDDLADEVAGLWGRAFLDSQTKSYGHFVQIFGKQNEPPVAKYLPYVQEFIREEFDSDPVSMLLAGVKARDLDLRGADLHGADLSGRDLSNTDLSRSNLRYAYLRKTNLSGASLKGAVLRYVDLNGADLSRADLSNADLTRATMRTAQLVETKLRSAVIVNAVASDANFANADLRNASLASMTAHDAQMTEADLADADLSDADLANANFFGANLHGASFRHSDLAGADLFRTNAEDADFRYSRLGGTRWGEAKVAGAHFGAAHWTDASQHDLLSNAEGVEDAIGVFGPKPIGEQVGLPFDDKET